MTQRKNAELKDFLKELLHYITDILWTLKTNSKILKSIWNITDSDVLFSLYWLSIDQLHFKSSATERERESGLR